MRSHISKILFVLIIASGLFAQFHPGPPMDPEMRDQLKTIRKWKLLEDLQLDDEQTAKFLPLMTRYENETEIINSEMEKKSSELQEIVFDEDGNKKNLSQKQQEMLRAKTMEMVELKKRLTELETGIIVEASEFLDPMQLFSLVTFERRFHKEIRELLQQFWHQRGGPYGPGDEGPGFRKKK